jgi:hypothetical protein
VVGVLWSAVATIELTRQTLRSGQAQALEGLRAGHLVHQVAVDVEHGGAVVLGVDDVLVPELVVQGACGHERRHHLRRRLHQFDQHALAADRELVVALRVDEADVVAGRALADAAGREAHAVRVIHSTAFGQVVDPQADVVQRRGVHGGLLVGVERLHQVDLDRVAPRPIAQMSSSTFSRSLTKVP